MYCMLTQSPSMAQQIAAVVMEFQRTTTGRVPKAVIVVLCFDTLVVTLHDALSPAERVLAESPEGAAQVQEFHRQLFAYSCQPLRDEIRRITGVAVREAVIEIEPASGAVVQAFTNNATVQLFRMAHRVPHDSWSSSSGADFADPACDSFSAVPPSN
jgi:uncharacterized protein YbcI